MINICTIPLRNLRRKPSKNLILLLVFTLGVTSIITLYQVSQMVGVSLEKKLTAFGANIIINQKSESLSVSYGGFNMGEMHFEINQLNEAETVAGIHSIGYQDRISIIAPKLVTTAKIGTTPVAVVGVRWQEEINLKSYWAIKGNYPEHENQVVLGKNIAEKLGFSIGDRISLFSKDFTISGILHGTGSDDDKVILVSLPLLQQLTKADNKISFIEIAAICSGCPIEDIVVQIRENLPKAEVKALQNIVNQRMASILFVQKLALMVSVIILITAASMVGLSMLSAVGERKQEIGILRSLGFTRAKIFFIFCLEAGLIGILAGLSGYVAGFFTSMQALNFLEMTQNISPVFSTAHLFLCGFISCLISVVSAIYPAWKGANTEPSAALVAL